MTELSWPDSFMLSLSIDIDETSGLSLLNRYRVFSVSFDWPFSIELIVITIVSLISTSLSSRSLVEIVILPEFSPAAITSGLLEIVNSSSTVAFPLTEKFTVTSFSEVSSSAKFR